MKEKLMGFRWVAKQLADMQNDLKATADETASSGWGSPVRRASAESYANAAGFSYPQMLARLDFVACQN